MLMNFDIRERISLFWIAWAFVAETAGNYFFSTSPFIHPSIYLSSFPYIHPFFSSYLSTLLIYISCIYVSYCHHLPFHHQYIYSYIFKYSKGNYKLTDQIFQKGIRRLAEPKDLLSMLFYIEYTL